MDTLRPNVEDQAVLLAHRLDVELVAEAVVTLGVVSPYKGVRLRRLGAVKLAHPHAFELVGGLRRHESPGLGVPDAFEGVDVVVQITLDGAVGRVDTGVLASGNGTGVGRL